MSNFDIPLLFQMAVGAIVLFFLTDWYKFSKFGHHLYLCLPRCSSLLLLSFSKNQEQVFTQSWQNHWYYFSMGLQEWSSLLEVCEKQKCNIKVSTMRFNKFIMTLQWLEGGATSSTQKEMIDMSIGTLQQDTIASLPFSFSCTLLSLCQTLLLKVTYKIGQKSSM